MSLLPVLDDEPRVVTADQAATAGVLLSVNVGLPRDVLWRGRTVHTGVWKSPVAGPQMVRELNIDGDGQGDLGGHGGPHRAVLVYQLDSYDHWRTHLGRDSFEYGQFGENFTVTGLSDEDVCIGDQLAIGDALFEVSQPRVTCYRVGLRLAEPRLPALLVSHRRPGFYLRVLREGQVSAGDPIVRVLAGPERLSVADADALLYLPGHDRAEIERALRIPALSPGWQASFRAMLEAPGSVSGNVGLTDAVVDHPVAWTGFRAVRVAAVTVETPTVRSLELTALDGEPLPAADPGQYIAIRADLGDGQPAAARSYSLSNEPGSPSYRVSIKREPGGRFSGFVAERLQVGDQLEIAAPRGKFVLEPDSTPVVLCSAGVGVTPVLAMLHALVRSGTAREVWWLHGARNSADHVLADEARSLIGHLENAHSQIFYSAPLPTDRLGSDYDHQGRIAADTLRGLPIPTDSQAYLCGPPAFMADLRTALLGLGLAGGRVHAEIFGSGPALTPGIAVAELPAAHQPAGEQGDGPSVSFSRTGLTVSWRTDFDSVLELAEACDVPTRWSCRTGVCHTCETALLAGAVTYDPAPVDPPAQGNVLLCCATPDGELVLDL